MIGDIQLTEDGDIQVTETGDIMLTDSIRQAVLIRLRWFFGEWRFSPGDGLPHFEEIFIKNPNIPKIKSLLRTEIMSVDGVVDVKNIEITTDNQKRFADVSFYMQTNEDEYREEVRINAGIA